MGSVEARDPGAMVTVPVRSLTEEEHLQLLRQQELQRQQMKRARETSADPMWPRRKKSDLMAHLGPASRPQRSPAAAEVPKEPTPGPVKIPIQKKSSGQDSMWPRRRKSDLLIYQMARSLN